MDEPVDVAEVEKELEEELGSEDLEEELESRASEDEEAAEDLESEGSEDDEDEAEEPEDEEEDEELDLDEEDEDSDFVEAKKRGSRKEREEFDEEDIVEERFYTIPLRKVWIVPRKKRAPKAARVVRSFVLKHMKVRTEAEEEEEPEKLVIDPEVNELLWSRGIEKPPRKIRVRVVRDKEGVVTVLPAEGD